VLYNYLASRDRFGVVGNANKKTVKDCYVLPLAGAGAVPPTLLDLEADLPGGGRSDSLLCMIVRTKRDRGTGGRSAPDAAAANRSPAVVSAAATTASSSSYKPAKYHPAPPAVPSSANRHSKKATVPPVLEAARIEDDEPYEPEDEEPYSPGNSPPEIYAQPAGYSTGKVIPARGPSPPLLRCGLQDVSRILFRCSTKFKSLKSSCRFLGQTLFAQFFFSSDPSENSYIFRPA
jgi:hypothetical protein